MGWRSFTPSTVLAGVLVALALGVAASLPGLQEVAVAAAVFIALVGVILEAPEYSLLAFLVARPVVDSYVYTSVAGLTLGQLWGLGLLCTILVYFLAHRQAAALPAPVSALLLAYLGLTLVRPDLGVAADSALKLASWLLLAVAVERISTTRRGQQAVLTTMWWCGVVLIVMTLLAISQGRYGAAYYGLDQASADYSTRPHALASMAVLLLPFALIYIVVGRKVRLSALLGGLLVVGIIASFVRTAYLASLAVLVAYVVTALRMRAARARVSILAIGAVMIFTAIWFQDAIVGRLADLPLVHKLLGGELQNGGGSGRVEFEKDLLVAGTDNPLHLFLGRGAGASVKILSQMYNDPIWSHNDFLEFFVTGGLILLCAYLVFLAWALVGMVRLYRDPRQSPEVHASSIIMLGGFGGFVVLSAANGIALTAGATVMAVLIGLTRGMLQTPGSTALDAERAATPQSAEAQSLTAGPPRPTERKPPRS
jgi:hypothetical protein